MQQCAEATFVSIATFATSSTLQLSSNMLLILDQSSPILIVANNLNRRISPNRRRP
ncbi:hypothetical protein TWF730_005761 [Orbilia blumenaviensis]|uniref:Uncharacterized protein n=1 Tax=Orbilia blumenaviensis TaxID=1796055 RepID=A0AAV9VKG6_9PEZI